MYNNGQLVIGMQSKNYDNISIFYDRMNEWKKREKKKEKEKGNVCMAKIKSA